MAEVRAEEGGLGGCAGDDRRRVPRRHGRAAGAGADHRRHGVVTGDPEEFLAGEYGRLRTVVLDAEGALWITTSNRDGVGTPNADDDRVLRIQPPTTTGSSPL